MMRRRRLTTSRSKPTVLSTRTSYRSDAAKVPSEHVEQRTFVSAFRRHYRDVRIFAIPNGEARSRVTGARLKLEGVSAGVPDLFVPAWLCWIEMKRQRGGVVSTVQRDWHEYLRDIGHTVIVAKGCEDALTQVAEVKKSVDVR